MLLNDNISPSLVTRENILTSPIDEEGVTGSVHSAIYRAREDVNAIVHAHPFYAIVLSTIDEEFIPIHNNGVIFHGKIKLYKSHGQVKTRERAEEIAKLLGDGRAILQRGHGTVVVGRGLIKAVLGTIYLEEAAKTHLLAKQMGTPQYIAMELSAEITEQVFKERPKKRTWDHYASKSNRGIFLNHAPW